MALFNYATKEITLKIVYYGPGLSGKTTNLQHLYAMLNPEAKGKLLSLSTESDRTLFFDFLPVELGKIRDFSIRFQLYTVPGQVRYNATRKVVLKGADAVVFVADSQRDMKDQNIESFENMRENLVSNNIDPDTIPVVLQYNKRDLKNILTIEELNQDLNIGADREVLEATAINGMGVEEAFKKITKLALKDISKRHRIEIQPADTSKELPKPSIKGSTEAEMLKDLPAPVKVEAQAPVSSVEPQLEINALESADNDLDLLSEQETDSVEVIAEAEPYDSEHESGLTSRPGYGTVTEVEPVITEHEPVSQRPVPSASDAPLADLQQAASSAEAMPPKKELPEKHLQSLHTEKIEGLYDQIALVSMHLSRFEDTLALLQKTVSDLKADVGSIRNDMARLQERSDKEPDRKDVKEYMELRHGQKEVSDLLRDVLDLLSSIKEKKSWFKL